MKKKGMTLKEKEPDSKSSGGIGTGVGGLKGVAKTNARLEKIEKYLQDRFNWLNIKKNKTPDKNSIEKKKFSINMSPYRIN